MHRELKRLLADARSDSELLIAALVDIRGFSTVGSHVLVTKQEVARYERENSRGRAAVVSKQAKK